MRAGQGLCNKISMSDDEAAARAELQAMTRDQLSLVDHDVYYWPCCIEGCNNKTLIRDYGLAPLYWTRWGWYNLNRDYQYFCGRHTNFYKMPKLPEGVKKQGTPIDYIIKK